MEEILSLRKIPFLLLMIPVAAWADLSGTATIPAGSALNLDTGIVSGSGDLLYSGTQFTAQGKAKAFDDGNVGLAGFNFVTLAFLQASAPAMSNQPFKAVAGDIIDAMSSSGNFSKILVTAISGTSATVQYLTYGAAAAAPAPSVTAIQNNYSYLQAGMPNYGIAPGSLFIIKGTDLANSTTAVLQSSAGSGIPTTLNGASITVTVNGVTVHPGMYYAIATQIAAVLPSSTPVGTGTITVSYGGGTSAVEPILVVPTALGLDTYFGTGVGLGVATDPVTGVPYFFNNSAKPGQTIVLWGSGLGADTADSDLVYTSSPHAINVPLQIYIGGILATIGYQGASGYPGLNQINVTIPASIQTGCGVSIVAVSGNIVSNTVSIPVEPGGGNCTEPIINGTGTVPSLNPLKSGSLTIVQATGTGQPQSSASADFISISGLVGTNSTNGNGLYSLENCAVFQSLPGVGLSGGATNTGLDAGTITFAGPSGTVPLPAVASLPGDYDATLPLGFVPTSGGSFVFTGTGGKDVGPFTATLNYSNPMVWTNESSIAAVNRSQGVTLTWTGGDPDGFILITGTTTSPGGVNGSVSAGFVCYAPVSPGQFTVPPFVLLGVPGGTGTLTLENVTTPKVITIPGIDYATSSVAFYFSLSLPYQ